MGVLINQSLQTRLPSGRCCSQLASQFPRRRVNLFRTWVNKLGNWAPWPSAAAFRKPDHCQTSVFTEPFCTFCKLAWSCQECGNQTDTVGCALVDQTYKHALMALTREASTKRESIAFPTFCFLHAFPQVSSPTLYPALCTLPSSPLLACFCIW